MDPAALQNLTQEQKTAIMAQAQQQANQQIVSFDTPHLFYQTCIFPFPTLHLIFRPLNSELLYLCLGPNNNNNNR